MGGYGGGGGGGGGTYFTRLMLYVIKMPRTGAMFIIVVVRNYNLCR